MPSSALKKPYSSSKPWKAKYKGKWYDVLDEEDQGAGKKNKYYLEGVPGGPVTIEDLDPFGIGGGVLKKETIASVLERRYKDKTRDAIESVAADIYYSGEPESVLASGTVIDKLFNRYSTQKNVEAKKASVDSNEYCPICKIATSDIKLVGGRPAKYCRMHHVVFPAKVKKND
jgi:hypothetical protein